MEALQTGEIVQPIRSTWRDYLNLSKPLTTMMLTLAALAALYTGAGDAGPSLTMALVTVTGGALAAAGANALNSYKDMEADALMYHTRARPLPGMRVEPGRARLFGIVASGLGVLVFGIWANLIAAALTAAGVLFYVFVYTAWLKKRTVHNSLVSGVAWAMPVLVGWSTAGKLSAGVLVLFGILVYWAPILSISRGMAYKRDYKIAGIPLLPVVHGDRPARRQVLVYAVLLVLMSFTPVALGMLYSYYGLAAISLGGLMLVMALFVHQNPGAKSVRLMMIAARIYLIALFAAMILDRIVFITR